MIVVARSSVCTVVGPYSRTYDMTLSAPCHAYDTTYSQKSS